MNNYETNYHINTQINKMRVNETKYFIYCN